MKAAAIVLCCAAFALPAIAGDEVPPSAYVGASGALDLPQGGSRMGRLGGADVFAGIGFCDEYSFEGVVGWHERYAFLAVRQFVHFYACDMYDRLFGYSAFDPFFTWGACGWVGKGPGQVGPSVGVGALYHFDDNWSLRAEASAVLGLDGGVEMVYSVSVGVQYSFGQSE